MTSTEPTRSVTFVGHDASRTGAPILLASALRWATDHVTDQARLRLVLLGGGPLLDEYRRILPTRVTGGGPREPAARLVAAARSVGLPCPSVRRRARPRSGTAGADVVVANTLASLPAASRLARRHPGTALVCHVHELDGVADRVLPAGRRRSTLDQVDRFVAAGDPVAEMLVRRWGVPSGDVFVVDEWTEPRRRSRQVTTWSPTVVAVGAMRHRKGPDRFVDMMSLLADHPAGPAGIWIGGSDTSVEAAEMRDDVARSVDPAGIAVLADRADPWPVIESAAVVVSTAIEDPYPLAVLEAAAAGVPVAGFASGGIVEVLDAVGQSDALVPVDDVIGLAGVVGRLLDDPAERRRRGDRLAAWVRSTHSTEQMAPRWWDAVVG